MPLPTRRFVVVLPLKHEGRFVIAGGVKPNPLSGMSGVRILFKKVAPFVTNLVGKFRPLSFLRVSKFKFLTCLLQGKKIIFTAISNVTNALNTVPIKVESLSMYEAVLQEFHSVRPPHV